MVSEGSLPFTQEPAKSEAKTVIYPSMQCPILLIRSSLCPSVSGDGLVGGSCPSIRPFLRMIVHWWNGLWSRNCNRLALLKHSYARIVYKVSDGCVAVEHRIIKKRPRAIFWRLLSFGWHQHKNGLRFNIDLIWYVCNNDPRSIPARRCVWLPWILTFAVNYVRHVIKETAAVETEGLRCICFDDRGKPRRPNSGLRI